MASPERNVQLRYIILDACMAKARREESVIWTKEALLTEVNRQLRADNPATKPIAMRTLEKDIVDMETMYGLRIERGRVGGKVHLTYAADSDGIHRAHLAQNELALAHRFIQSMDRFKGVPAWDWWIRSKAALQGQLGLIGGRLREEKWKPRIVDATFSKDERRWYELLVRAAYEQTPLRMAFAPGMGDRLERVAFLTDQLIQQTDGILALGSAWDAEAESFFHLVVALDEITSIDAVAVDWPDGLEPQAFNWEVHTANHIALTPGVVSFTADKVVPVRVWVSSRLAQRFLKEPMHGSQDMRIEHAAKGVIFNISLVPDEQFVRFALQWGSEFQVLEPDVVRHALRMASRAASDRYAPMFGP
ncbi:MAG: hypothetical protein CL828_05110 [Crocinitomicaceae bacterium]|nr:hypothetical protein [Crocinitomicaceae bacterium]